MEHNEPDDIDTIIKIMKEIVNEIVEEVVLKLIGEEVINLFPIGNNISALEGHKYLEIRAMDWAHKVDDKNVTSTRR